MMYSSGSTKMRKSTILFAANEKTKSQSFQLPMGNTKPSVTFSDKGVTETERNRCEHVVSAPFSHRGVNSSRHMGCIKSKCKSSPGSEVVPQTKDVAPQIKNYATNNTLVWESWALRHLTLDSRLFIRERFGVGGGTGTSGVRGTGYGGGVYNEFGRRKSRHLFVIRDTDSKDPRIVAEV